MISPAMRLGRYWGVRIWIAPGLILMLLGHAPVWAYGALLVVHAIGDALNDNLTRMVAQQHAHSRPTSSEETRP